MAGSKVILILSSLSLYGVCGEEVSVMEGDNVTLHTEVIKQKDDVMVWCYGPEKALVAKTNGKIGETKYYDGENGTFKDRVMLNDQTGDLSIRDMRTEHSGLYTLKITINNKLSFKTFNVTVYAHLPVPVITRDCSSSSSKCSVLCSVVNVSYVSLSWYKGSSLLSNISVSDVNTTASLPLEVDYEDTNTYTCVLNNTITNQTQHLNITQHCHKCPVTLVDAARKRIIIIPVVFILFCVVCVIICVRIYRRRHARPAKVPLTDEEKSISCSSEDSEDS